MMTLRSLPFLLALGLLVSFVLATLTDRPLQVVDHLNRCFWQVSRDLVSFKNTDEDKDNKAHSSLSVIKKYCLYGRPIFVYTFSLRMALVFSKWATYFRTDT